MKKRKYTDIVIDIDSVFYRVGDRSIGSIGHEVIKNWFNTLKSNHNIYLVSNRLSLKEVEKKLRNYKIHRIPKNIYCYKDNIDFRRCVIEKLIKFELNNQNLSSVLFISGNPGFIAFRENLGITTCYVRELNKEYKEASIGTLSVDRVSAIASLGMYQTIQDDKKVTKNLNIKDYIYIIGSGYDLLKRESFNNNATFSREYKDTDVNNTLAVSDNLLELCEYKQKQIATLFINNGHNDRIDLITTYEKRLKI